MQYTESDASAYKALDITGTSYEPSYGLVQNLLGDLTGMTALDFGTGTGRTARLLKKLGALRVIAVDNSKAMLDMAIPETGIEYRLVSATLPIPDNTVDIALSASVLVEMGSTDAMTAACKEVFRTLRPNGVFVIATNNPEAVGANFVSYQYDRPSALKSGDMITCHVKSPQPFDIQDRYWIEQDYERAIRDAGFTIDSTHLPLAKGDSWLDETHIAPDIVYYCRKPSEPTI